jgi:hypothetical protein
VAKSILATDNSYTGQEFIPVVPKKVDGAIQASELKPLESTKVSPVPLPTTSPDAFIDLNHMWFDFNEGNYTDSNKEEKLTTFVKGLNDSFGQGKIPQIVNQYQLVLKDKKSYGFLDSIQPFPNGMIHVVTLVAPPIVPDDQRTFIFLVVQTEESKRSQVFKGLDVVPSDFAISPNGYLLVYGSKLDDSTFKNGETLSLLGFKVTTSGAELAEFKKLTDVPKFVTTQEDKNVVRFIVKDGKLTPYAYANNEQEGAIATKLFIVTTSGTEELSYQFVEDNGMLDIKSYKKLK